MTTAPGPRADPAPPGRRRHPRVLVLRWCALLWAVCTVGVLVLGGAAEAAEEESNHTAHYTGPSVVALEVGTAVALWLGAAAFAVGTGLVVDGAIRRAARRGAT